MFLPHPSDLFENYGVYWTYYRMFESSSLMLASILLTITCLIPDVIEQVIRASKDVRLEERRNMVSKSMVVKVVDLPCVVLCYCGGGVEFLVLFCVPPL